MTKSSAAKAKKSVDVKLDLETAADLAAFFSARGKPQQALQTYAAILKLDPHIDEIRRRYAELLFEINGPRVPLGTVERSRMLLGLMGMDVVTEAIESAYFENLDRLLSDRQRLAKPGTLVLGLGSGRCGTTSLARALSGIPTICASHENPPPMHWRPTADQLRIHCERFRRLLAYFPTVFDAAHWWLKAADDMDRAFDGVKYIALVRDPDACARSFLEQKGVGRNAINHWLEHEGLFWKPALWDRLYPSYPADRFGLAAPERLEAKDCAARQHALVKTYVEDYNDELDRLQARLGERLLILRTEDLSAAATARRIQAFLEIEGLDLTAVQNRGSLQDGDSPDLVL